MALYWRHTLSLLGTSLFFVYSQFMVLTSAYAQQLPGTENGEWRYLGGDAGNTRYSAPVSYTHLTLPTTPYV